MKYRKQFSSTFNIAGLVLTGAFLAACSVQQFSENADNERVETKTGEGFEIALHTIAAYKALESYQSNGKVRSISWRGVKKYERAIYVSIKLENPDRFLITWQPNPQRNPNLPLKLKLIPNIKRPSYSRKSGAIWSEGNGDYFVKYSDKEVEQRESARLAIATATGLASGGASNVPSLFFGDRVGLGNLFGLVEELDLLGTEEINGEPCHVLTGVQKSGTLVTYWISTNDSLIRQYAKAEKRPAWLEADEFPAYESEVLTDEEKELQAQLNPDRLHSFIDGKCVQLHASQLVSYSQETHTDISTPTFRSSDFEFDPTELSESANNVQQFQASAISK